MKKTLLFIACILSILYSYGYQMETQWSESQLKISYHFDSPSISTIEADSSLSVLHLSNLQIGSEVGKPALPQRTESFIMPQGTDISSISYSSVTDTIYMRCPAVPEEKIGMETEFTYSILPATCEGLWPASPIAKSRIGVYRDIPIGNICVIPFQYNSEEGYVIFHKDLDINISFVSSPSNRPSHGSLELAHSVDSSQLSSLLTIQDNIETAAPSASFKRVASNIFDITDGTIYRAPDYLVVAPQDFQEPAETFASWKRRMGYNVTLRIESNESLLNPDYIYNLIKEEYDQKMDLQYVLLLGGGYLICPYDSRYNDMSAKSLHTTDFYFSCMDGVDDYVPDLVIGRLPAHNVTDAWAMVNKSIEHEWYPPESDYGYYSNAMHAGVFVGSAVGVANTRFILTLEEITNYVESKSFNIGRCYTFTGGYPQKWCESYGGNSRTIPSYLKYPTFKWDATAESFKNGFEAAPSYVLYRGHAAFYKLHALNTFNTDMESYQNPGHYPIAFLITCQAGMFYCPRVARYTSETYSIAEALLKNPSGGSAGVIAANQISVSPHNDGLALGIFNAIFPAPGITTNIGEFTTHDPFGNISTQYYDVIPHPERKRCTKLGEILTNGMASLCETYGGTVAMPAPLVRMTRELFHCLGDPTLPFYRDEPTRKVPSFLCVGGEYVTIDHRDMVMVDKTTEEVYILTNTLSKPADRFKSDYHLSLVGEDYVPLLFTTGETESKAGNKITGIVDHHNDSYTITYTTANPSETQFRVYNQFGSLQEIVQGSDGEAKITFSEGFKIVVMEVESVICDSKTLK